MGKAAKKVTKSVVSAVKNAPKTLGKSAVDLGKSVMGKNGGNYFENLGESAANAFTVNSTGGLMGTKDLGSGNNMDKQIGDLMSPADLDAPPAAATDAGLSAEENAALKAEEENAKKKGRASSVLAGGSDSVGSTSAKRSLLGSL